jgi:GAF domain-containing protein
MLHENRSYGVLCVYAEQSNAFDEKETGLLVELAGDLAFALKALEEEAARRQAEEALRESEERYRRLSEELEQRVAERTAEPVFDSPSRNRVKQS